MKRVRTIKFGKIVKLSKNLISDGSIINIAQAVCADIGIQFISFNSYSYSNCQVKIKCDKKSATEFLIRFSTDCTGDIDNTRCGGF